MWLSYRQLPHLSYRCFDKNWSSPKAKAKFKQFLKYGFTSSEFQTNNHRSTFWWSALWRKLYKDKWRDLSCFQQCIRTQSSIGRLRINAGKENTRYINSFWTGLSFSEFSKENLHFLIIHRMKNKLGQTWSQA